MKELTISHGLIACMHACIVQHTCTYTVNEANCRRSFATIFGRDTLILSIIVIDVCCIYFMAGSTLSLEVEEVLEGGDEEEDGVSDCSSSSSSSGSPEVALSPRAALLSRLRIHFHYGSGIPGEPISALALHTDRGAFDKQSHSFTSREHVAAVLGEEGGGEGETAGGGRVVTSLSYAEFVQLYDDLVGGAHAGDGGDKGDGGDNGDGGSGDHDGGINNNGFI
jgi:hypothetical protein